MHVYYRISDNSYKKGKLPGTDKLKCLVNFFEALPDTDITIIADNCSDSLIKNIGRLTNEYNKKRSIRTIESQRGNAGALKFAIDRAMAEWDIDEVVYMVEDDYLHLSVPKGHPWNSIPSRDILEGLEIAEYVTLYDHPDKYLHEYGMGEEARVLKTKHNHWKISISTTMTFATKVRYLSADLEIWEKYTSGSHPHDHQIFQELKGEGRKLAVRIPGTACHTDLTYSEVKHGLQMEPWALAMAEWNIKEEILRKAKTLGSEELDIFNMEPGLKKLILMESMLHCLQ